MRLKRIISTGLAVVLSVTVISFVPECTVAYAATPPSIGAQGAAVYNANTGEFLYEKNGDTQFAPASITKIMTGLLTVEQANLDDTVYFKSSAVANLDSGATTLPVRVGDSMSVRDALSAIVIFCACFAETA